MSITGRKPNKEGPLEENGVQNGGIKDNEEEKEVPTPNGTLVRYLICV